LNTASVAGLVNTPGLSAYSASKHAVVSMSETLYLELKESRSQLGVSVLCPAWVQTNIQNAQKNRLPRYQNQSEVSSESSMRYEAQMHQAITHAKLSASEIALCAFDAIDRNDFYVLPHRKINPLIERRMQDILTQRNPFIDGGSKQ
jgi:short-subunit dehydrogenase